MFGQRYGSAILRAPEGDPAGGGGSGEGGEPVKPFTDEQLTAIGQVVNAATTSQLKRMLGPSIAEGLKGMNWGELLTPEITKLVPPPSNGSGGGDDDPAGGKGGKGKSGNSELERRVQELASQLETEKKQRQAADEARQKAEQDRRVDAAKIKLRNALQDKVAPGALEHAVDRLTIVQNRLKVDENGNVTFRVKRAPYKGAPDEETDVSLEEAIPAVLAEEDMKIFVAAPKGNSDGRSPAPRGSASFPNYATPAQTDEEKAKRAYEKEQALLSRYGDR